MKSCLPLKTLTLALLGLSLAARADYASTVQSLNPPGWWRLNEPAQPPVPTYPMNNSSTAGAALNGLYYGVPLLGQPGAMPGSTAPSLNGSSQYAEVPYSALMNPTGPFTVEFWANLTNNTAGAKSGVVSRYITIPGGPTGQTGYLFFANNGNVNWQFRVYNGTGAHTVTDTFGPAIQADTWFHVVGVFDGTEIKIYVNGFQNSPAVAATYVANTNTPLRIGAGTTEAAPTLFFPGLIDNVAVYPAALSAEQILENYNTAFGNPAGYNARVLSLNPNAFWQMNEPAVPPYVPFPAANSGTLGAAYNGTYSAGATSGVPGPQGGQFAGFEADNRAVLLNGSNGDVTMPALNWFTENLTIAAWVNLQRYGPSDLSGVVFSRGSSATGLDIRNTGELRYHWQDGQWGYSSGLIVPTNQWVFVALAVEPTQAVLYMGTAAGLVSRTNATAHGFANLSDPLYIGRDSAARRLAGRVDEAMIMDTTLAYDTISNLFYSATPAIFNVTRTPANPVFEGVNVTFTANAASASPMNYQWRKNGSPVGNNSSVLSLVNVTPADDGEYYVVVTSGSQSVTGAVDTLTVVAGPPVILTQPTPLTRYAGASASFSVVAGGTTPFSYQWLKNGGAIEGATDAVLTLTSLTSADQANYSVRVTNPNGQIVSATAALTVLPAPSEYASLALQRGAANYWSLNETSGTNAFDYAGGLTGTFAIPPAVTPGVNGPRPPGFDGFPTDNTAYQLDGVNGWVTAPPLNWNTNTATFSAWVYLTGYDDDLSGVVFSRGSSASGIHILGTGELRYHWDGGQWGWSSGLTVPLNEWVFLALVVTPTSGTVYMGTSEGLVSGVNNTGHGVAALDDPFFLGRDRTDRPLVGLIDEVALFKRALSQGDIGALYGVGTGIPLVITMTPGGLIEDTKPLGVPHDGYNYGSTWLASSGPDNSWPTPLTREGVQQFSAAQGSQIVVPSSPDFDAPQGTISFWMRAGAPIPGPGNEGAIIFDRRTSAGIVIVLEDSGAIFVQSAGNVNIARAGYLPDDNWHLVTVTYDQSEAGNITIYIDNFPGVPSPNAAAWSWPEGQQLELGRSHDGYWKRYDGQLDDFRFYNRILTEAEVAQIYATGALVDTGALKLRFNFDTAGGGYTLSWPFGTLESSPRLGPDAEWTPVPGATSPWPISPLAPALFYRISL